MFWPSVALTFKLSKIFLDLKINIYLLHYFEVQDEQKVYILFYTIVICFDHRLIKITERTLDVVFSIFMCVSFTITLKQKPKGVTLSQRRTGSLSIDLQDRQRACSTPLGFCIRVSVNETHKNLKKTTSDVLSVILTNLWLHHIDEQF